MTRDVSVEVPQTAVHPSEFVAEVLNNFLSVCTLRFQNSNHVQIIVVFDEPAYRVLKYERELL